MFELKHKSGFMLVAAYGFLLVDAAYAGVPRTGAVDRAMSIAVPL